MGNRTAISIFLYSTFIMITLSYFSSVTFAEEYPVSGSSITENNQRIDKIKDFKEDKESAKKWAEKEFEKWNKGLKAEEKEAFEELKDTKFYFDMDKFGKDLSGMTIEEQSIKEKGLRYISFIDRALSSKNAKLNESLKVYQNSATGDIIRDLKDETIFEKDGKVNQEKYNELKETLIGMRYEGYKVADLAYSPENDKRFKLEISLPKGENVGYAFENQIVLNKDKALDVTKISRIIEKGKEKIKIEAKLVAKEKVDKKINEANNKENSELNQRMGFEETKKLLEYRFTSAQAEHFIKEAQTIFHDAENRIDRKVLQSTLNVMNEKDGKIYFVDRNIATYPEVYKDGIVTEEEKRKFWDTAGLTMYEKRSIFIDMIDSKNPNERSNTLVHEIGHMVDMKLGDEYWGESKKRLISSSGAFIIAFKYEGKNLTEYAATNRAEFFAEAFRMYYSNDPKEVEELKTKAPDTYSELKDLLTHYK